MENKKKDADFQDEYHRSSNFEQLNEKEDFKIKGDGELKTQNDPEMQKREDKEKIKDAFKEINTEEE